MTGNSWILHWTFSREERRKKWNGQFFATKAEQCEYLECICGSEDAAENDSKHRVQCSTCRLWQHSGWTSWKLFRCLVQPNLLLVWLEKTHCWASITVRVVSSLTGLDSTKQENVFLYVIKLLNPNQSKWRPAVKWYFTSPMVSWVFSGCDIKLTRKLSLWLRVILFMTFYCVSVCSLRRDWSV